MDLEDKNSYPAESETSTPSMPVPPLPMVSTPLGRSGILNKLSSRKFLLISLAVLIFLYVLALHPISGFLGGLVLLFTGWLIPSLINILLTLFILTFIPNRTAKIILLIPLSLVIGVNTNFYVWIRFALAPNPAVAYTINKPIEPRQDQYGAYIATKYSGIKMRDDVFSPAVAWAWDEGCVCSYWIGFDRDPFNAYISGHNRNEKNTIKLNPPKDSEKEQINIVFSKSGDGIAMINVNVLDNNDEIIATFKETEIRYTSTNPSRIGGRNDNRGLLNGHFAENVFDILLHGNFWPFILSGVDPLRRFQDTDALDKFLVQAVVGLGNTNVSNKEKVMTATRDFTCPLYDQFEKERFITIDNVRKGIFLMNFGKVGSLDFHDIQRIGMIDKNGVVTIYLPPNRTVYDKCIDTNNKNIYEAKNPIKILN